MKKILLWALLAMSAGFQRAEGAEYKAEVLGDFIVVTQKGYSENQIVSIRKSSVISVRLNGRRVVVVTSALEVVKELKDGKEILADRSLNYTFDNDQEAEAKRLFDFIMREVGT